MYCQYYNLNGDLVTASLTTGSENDLYVKPNTKVVIWASNWQSSNTINPQPSINNHTSLANVTKAYFMKPNVALHLIHILYDGDGSYKTWFQQEGLENLNIYKYE